MSGSKTISGNWIFRKSLLTIRVPILIIQGEDDQYGTVKQIEIAQEECYCPVDVALLPGVKHTPHREALEVSVENDCRIHRPRLAWPERGGHSRLTSTLLRWPDRSESPGVLGDISPTGRGIWRFSAHLQLGVIPAPPRLRRFLFRVQS